MKRRGFLKSIAAASAVSVMPVRALAARTGTAGVATIARANLYTWSAMIARTKGTCSPEILIKALNVDPAKANFLFNRLISNNVVNVAGSTIVNQTRTALSSNQSGNVNGETLKLNAPKDDDNQEEIHETNDDANEELSNNPSDHEIMTRNLFEN